MVSIGTGTYVRRYSWGGGETSTIEADLTYPHTEKHDDHLYVIYSVGRAQWTNKNSPEMAIN